MKHILIFPLFNALIGAIFGAAIGYYISRLEKGIMVGGPEVIPEEYSKRMLEFFNTNLEWNGNGSDE